MNLPNRPVHRTAADNCPSDAGFPAVALARPQRRSVT
jgi:hypothetical protein